MTRFLLDVNVLIALVDPAHVQHDAAHAWFARVGSRRGKLATMDRKLAADAVATGHGSLEPI